MKMQKQFSTVYLHPSTVVQPLYYSEGSPTYNDVGLHKEVVAQSVSHQLCCVFVYVTIKPL